MKLFTYIKKWVTGDFPDVKPDKDVPYKYYLVRTLPATILIVILVVIAFCTLPQMLQR